MPTIFPAHDTGIQRYHCVLTPFVCNKCRRIRDSRRGIQRDLSHFERECAKSSRTRRAWPNRETNEARGRGFLHGSNRSEAWAPHDIRYVVPTGPPSHFPPSAFLTLGTASSLSGAEIEGPKRALLVFLVGIAAGKKVVVGSGSVIEIRTGIELRTIRRTTSTRLGEVPIPCEKDTTTTKRKSNWEMT